MEKNRKDAVSELEQRLDEISEMSQDTTFVKDWARAVVNHEKLTEEQASFSENLNEVTKKFIKYDSASARDEISQLISLVVEPEIYGAPSKILGDLFDEGEVGEFDKIKIRKSPKNTIVVQESAARTGNVNKSYLDFTEGNLIEKHLEVETAIRMSDLRRDGAFTIADIMVKVIEAFDNKKFYSIFDYFNTLITSGGANYIESAGGMTKAAVDGLCGYVRDMNTSGVRPKLIGLSSVLGGIYDFENFGNFSTNMKDAYNQNFQLDVYKGTQLVPISDGKLDGEDKKLFPEKVIVGICGKIGKTWTKGMMRTLVTPDNNSEKINLKITGVEFGVFIDDIKKCAKLIVTG